ncbi:cysteine--tRNA ligase [Xylanibacillus composti]|uniref:Cysteine--tRNA ligase n=1 Tax=Xylanibacillus composti TaxID=1572762 RepID=A0A8J4M324_9BACL|nr:cysteine--tRNA ligase [Xylanibacillus composti]MDT9727073.1 cysteine--tRNA ligase [Xylanibacillus composti]GIQ70339.1 cysteine--tRNA ligase [Xylanibacillus composti]
MTLHIYNSMSRRKEKFEPLAAGKVAMYVCGPTVYGYIHIGNARPVIFFDTVRRYLTVLGYEVRYVMNYTDVDDKLIRKAEEMGKTVPEVAEQFIQAFNEDVRKLGVAPAIHPRVTETIPEIIDFIRRLEEEGYAYENGGDVFYRTSKFDEYGKLSHQKLEELQFGKRIEVDERKEHAQDFVLWKKAKPGEIYWESPWGQGRPGWHIECSAMAHKLLGDTIDIHGGGLDLQFPHHECEIAQSEAYTGKPLARYWMHNGYIQINNEKMSKSLHNGVLVHDILERIKPQAVRMFMLSTHYRSPLSFSDDALKQAEQSLNRIQNAADNLRHRMNAAVALSDEDSAAVLEKLEETLNRFHAKMQDDFNTPDAITAVFDLVSELNVYMERPQTNLAVLQRAEAILSEMDAVLGILREEEQTLLDEQVEALIQERVEARKAKNWARADEIRDELAAQGILLEDTPQGIRWRRK